MAVVTSSSSSSICTVCILLTARDKMPAFLAMLHWSELRTLPSDEQASNHRRSLASQVSGGACGLQMLGGCEVASD